MSDDLASLIDDAYDAVLGNDNLKVDCKDADRFFAWLANFFQASTDTSNVRQFKLEFGPFDTLKEHSGKINTSFLMDNQAMLVDIVQVLIAHIAETRTDGDVIEWEKQRKDIYTICTIFNLEIKQKRTIGLPEWVSGDIFFAISDILSNKMKLQVVDFKVRQIKIRDSGNITFYYSCRLSKHYRPYDELDREFKAMTIINKENKTEELAEMLKVTKLDCEVAQLISTLKEVSIGEPAYAHGASATQFSFYDTALN